MVIELSYKDKKLTQDLITYLEEYIKSSKEAIDKMGAVQRYTAGLAFEKLRAKPMRLMLEKLKTNEIALVEVVNK